MRFLQLPLWLAIAIGLAVFFGSVDKDFATALIFASSFGLIYGGTMSLMKPPGGRKSAWNKHTNTPRRAQRGFGRPSHARRRYQTQRAATRL